MGELSDSRQLPHRPGPARGSPWLLDRLLSGERPCGGGSLRLPPQGERSQSRPALGTRRGHWGGSGGLKGEDEEWVAGRGMEAGVTQMGCD